jgi:uncharacterized protein involved in response to NO
MTRLDGRERRNPARRPVAAGTVFYPAATAYAVFAPPAFVLPALGLAPALPGLANGSAHAHEMLFGFALAALAGHQAGAMSRPRLALLVTLWGAARASFLAAPASFAAAAANVAFAMALLALVLPRLAGAGKNARNVALPATITMICTSAVAFHAASLMGLANAHGVLRLAMLFFALLLLLRGGRILAPAIAGQLYRQGESLGARVQPAIEWNLIGAMALAVAGFIAGGEGLWRALAAAALVSAGVLAAARLARWRVWALQGRPDLICLAAGYGWLAAGLALWGAGVAAGAASTAALHLVAIGALGTLTLNVMAMAWRLRARADPARARIPVWGTGLVALAALARAAAELAPAQAPALIGFAALAWSGAYVLLGVMMLRLKPFRHAPEMMAHHGEFDRSAELARAGEQRGEKQPPIGKAPAVADSEHPQ